MALRVWPADAVSGAPLYSGRMLRQSLVAPLLAGATSARPLGARSGVRPGTSASTVTATSTTWTCLPHAGVLDPQTAVEAGPYGYAVDAAVTGSVTAANATNPRVDIVYVQLSDPAEGDGTSAPGVTVAYLAGTAAATPAAPTTPARSMVLAQISVPASGGGSPSVTWVAPRTAAAGGIIPCASAADFATATALGTSVDPAWVAYSGRLYRSDGTATTYLTPAPEWTAVTLASGWANLSGHPVQYRVIDGQCEVRGTAQYAGLTANAAVNVVAAGGLPGEISSAAGAYPLFAAGASNSTTFAAVMINVRADGGMRAIATATMTGTVVVTLDGMRYRTA